MKFETIDPINDKRWLNFITEINNSNIFHHPAWLKVLKKQYKFEVRAACFSHNTNQISVGLPYCIVKVFGSQPKIISLPFTDHCSILGNDSQWNDKLYKEFILLSQKEKLPNIELRTFVNSQDYVQDNSLVLHITELEQDQDKLFSKFKKSQVQQIIKKADSFNLTVHFETSYSAVQEFYKLHLLTRKKLGVPIQPRNFFKLIFSEIIDKNLGFVIVVKKNGIPVSAGLFMFYNEYFTYKFGASNPDYLKYRPNNVMIWEAMKEASKRGFKYFDFGKTEIDNSGLRKFKSGWGTNEYSLIYSFYPKQYHSSLSKLKDKIISPLIQNSPKFVCQLIGEIGYKYFPSL